VVGDLLDCFSRGLVKEALGQLAGLKRRKLALQMLGAEIQAGLDKRDAVEKKESATSTGSQKRKLDTTDHPSESGQQDQTDDATERMAKKMRTDASNT